MHVSLLWPGLVERADICASFGTNIRVIRHVSKEIWPPKDIYAKMWGLDKTPPSGGGGSGGAKIRAPVVFRKRRSSVVEQYRFAPPHYSNNNDPPQYDGTMI